jgi:hypothetical protein
MQLNNPIFINQTDADIRYVNTTGDAINGNLTANNLIYNTGNQTISGNKIFSNTIYGNMFVDKNPLNFYDTIKTGRMTILSGIGPFQRRVYSGSLGVLNNPNETVVFFGYTGNPNQFSNKREMLRYACTKVPVASFARTSSPYRSHAEPICKSAESDSNFFRHVFDYGIIPWGIGQGNVNNASNSLTMTLGNSSIPLIYVNKDYLQTHSTYNFSSNSVFMVVPSGNPSGYFYSTAGNLSFGQTGVTYADMQNQYNVGFMVGFYAGPFGSFINPFRVAGASDGTSAASTSGCMINFESAWLSDGPNNETWLNLAFQNMGPSGILSSTANPTGLTINVYAID